MHFQGKYVTNKTLMDKAKLLIEPKSDISLYLLTKIMKTTIPLLIMIKVCYTTLTFALKPKVSSLVCLSVKMSGIASVTNDTNSSTFP